MDSDCTMSSVEWHRLYNKERLRANAAEEKLKALEARTPAPKVVRVIFDGPPSHESGRFVECEDEQGRGIKAGEWKELENGLWELRIEVANESI